MPSISGFYHINCRDDWSAISNNSESCILRINLFHWSQHFTLHVTSHAIRALVEAANIGAMPRRRRSLTQPNSASVLCFAWIKNRNRISLGAISSLQLPCIFTGITLGNHTRTLPVLIFHVLESNTIDIRVRQNYIVTKSRYLIWIFVVLAGFPTKGTLVLFVPILRLVGCCLLALLTLVVELLRSSKNGLSGLACKNILLICFIS